LRHPDEELDMKRPLFLFISLLPAVAIGQQKDFNPATTTAVTATSTQTFELLSANGNETSAGPVTTVKDDAASGQAQAPIPSRKSKPPEPKPGDGGWHPIDGSNVGYIDNAVVGSEVIVRVEDEIQNLTPDLAEFLFPHCNCSGDPGPGTGPPGLAKNVNAQTLHLFGEYALKKRFSVFTEVPIRWLQPMTVSFQPNGQSFASQSGLADVMAGFKFALVASPQRYVTFEVQSFFPSGDPSKGLGTNHYGLQPSILYYQRLTNRLTVESEFGELHPIGGSPGFAGDVINYGVGPSYTLFRGNGVGLTPLVEFIGWRVLNGMVTHAPLPRPGSDNCILPPEGEIATPCSAVSNLLNLKGGARVAFGSHNSVYLGYGRALTGLYWYLRVFRLEYRYSF
jgi:hypothetical protein